MFKALIATAAITVCCLGNDYPAKADNYDYMGRIVDAQVQRIEQQRQQHQLERMVRDEVRAQQPWGQW